MALDLSLLPHLSEDALRDEARRRRIDDRGLDRDGLIAALRRPGGRGGAEAGGGEGSPVPGAAELREAARKSGVETARGGGAAGDRSARGREGAGDGSARPAEREGDEPIKTRTLAELLLEQGHPERAAQILAAVAEEEPADAEVAELRHRAEAEASASRLEAAVRARYAAGGTFIDVVTVDGRPALAFAIDDEGLARGRAVLGARGRPAVRRVVVSQADDGAVRSRSEDEPLDARRGGRPLGCGPGERLVAAIGVVSGGRFAAVAHVVWKG